MIGAFLGTFTVVCSKKLFLVGNLKDRFVLEFFVLEYNKLLVMTISFGRNVMCMCMHESMTRTHMR